jgi:hypothetical protein
VATLFFWLQPDAIGQHLRRQNEPVSQAMSLRCLAMLFVVLVTVPVQALCNPLSSSGTQDAALAPPTDLAIAEPRPSDYCALVTPDLQRQLLEQRRGRGRCPLKCIGCGCKNGPGYRAMPASPGKKGQCVGYANILSVCGPPPHLGCLKECAVVEPVCKVPRPRKLKTGKTKG